MMPGDDSDEGTAPEPHAATWIPAQGQGDEPLSVAGQSPKRDWPSFDEMLAAGPETLARYRVRVV